jgi:hypothetical protein
MPMARRRVLDCFAFVASVGAAIWLTYGWEWGVFHAIGAGLIVFLLITFLAGRVLVLGILRGNGGRI